mgnify:CR=1 FL=1
METQNEVLGIIAAVVAIYEALSRIIPTSKVWSIIGNIINPIKKISDLLDNRDETKPKRGRIGRKS